MNTYLLFFSVHGVYYVGGSFHVLMYPCKSYSSARLSVCTKLCIVALRVGVYVQGE